MPTETKLTEADLAQFTGTEHWYRHWTGRGTFTDGIKFMADRAGAYWLIDVVFSHQLKAKVRAEPFQIWELKVKDGKGVVTMRRDSDCKPIVTQRLEYTDFPMAEVKMYFENDVLLLPSER